MRVAWNIHRVGFQTCWLWQFGRGPFEVVEISAIPETPRWIGPPSQPESVQICFEPGNWYTILLPAKHHFNEYDITCVTLFHEKWFVANN